MGEILIYTVLGVGVFIEILKKNGLNTNILAVVATVLGAIILTLLGGFTVTNVIIGAVVGAASSGFYDAFKGLKEALKIVDLFSGLINKDNDDKE